MIYTIYVSRVITTTDITTTTSKITAPRYANLNSLWSKHLIYAELQGLYSYNDSFMYCFPQPTGFWFAIFMH